MPSPDHRYRSYLLRLWWVETDAARQCRVALESTLNGERWTFADLDAVMAFLNTQANSLSVPHGATDE